MKAAVLREVHRPLEIEEVQIDKPGPEEVLVRTIATGVCHSDLHYADGLYACPVPTILGHEAAGIVEKVGSQVSYLKPGDHVIACISAFCGCCSYCLTGRSFSCQSKNTVRGEQAMPRLHFRGSKIHQFYNLSSFAEKMLIHEHALVKIRKDMPLDRAALIGCAVTTGFGAVVHTAKIQPGATVAVVGCGGVGLSAINGAAIAGAGRIIAIDLIKSKLELARHFGATDLINASDTEVVGAVIEMTRGGVEYSFEAVGLKDTCEQAFRMLRPSGIATIIGMVPEGQMIEIHGADLLDDKRLQGSDMGSNNFRVDMPKYIDFYMANKLKLDAMISRRIGLAEVNDAFEELRQGTAARSVIVFEDAQLS